MALKFTTEDNFRFNNVIVRGENVLGSLQRDDVGNYVYSYIEVSTKTPHTIITSNREELLNQPGITLQHLFLV